MTTRHFTLGDIFQAVDDQRLRDRLEPMTHADIERYFREESDHYNNNARLFGRLQLNEQERLDWFMNKFDREHPNSINNRAVEAVKTEQSNELKKYGVLAAGALVAIYLLR